VFADLSRAIRLTVMLEAKTDEALRDLVAGVAKAREATRVRIAGEARDAEAERRRMREEKVHDLVIAVACDDIADEADVERLDQELDERMLDDQAWWSDPARPLREVVERYCDWFGLTPDWSRWLGDDWAPPRAPPVWPWAARAEATGPP
ncbi:MAG TPA: hypothetical protein VFC47_08735, partial [Caulobacteraceae bacterium]|nr:hypothetical protein [Caulobacteraceae bacterium]